MEQETGCSVIVPTLNEASTIRDVLREIASVLGHRRWPFEIIVVDDSSGDGTAEIAADLADGYSLPVRVLKRSITRPSLSSAILLGAQHAGFPIVCVLDADGSHDPAVIPRLVLPLIVGAADVSVASRYVAGGGFSNDWPLARRALSALASAPARLLTGVQDPMSGFFACSPQLMLQYAGRARGYKILFELLARSPRSTRVNEVPFRFSDRKAGSSKFGIRVAFTYFVQMVVLSFTTNAWRVRPNRPDR